MAIKLTVQAVKNADSRATRYILWDTSTKGFGLRVNVDGSKSYLLKYAFEGGQRWHTIGKHGSPWTPETARNEAIRVLTHARNGTDPQKAERERKAASTTIAELCDLYVTAVRAGQILTKFDTTKKATTLATDEGRILRHIKPLMGDKRVRDVRGKDVEDLLHAVAAGKTATDEKTGKHGRAIVKGGRGTATRTVGLLGGIFTFAVKKGLRPDNPVKGIQRFKDGRNTRYLSGLELRRLGEALAADETAWDRFASAHKEWVVSGREGLPPRPPKGAASPMATAAVRLLLFTGARRSEVLRLKWEHVDLKNGYLRLADSKTGAKDILLGAPAINLLDAMPKLNGSPYVFPSARGNGPYVGLPKAWEGIRVRAGLPDVRIHDLRHSFASMGASTGNSLLVIGALLGHRDPKTTQRYAHIAHNPAKAAADQVAQTIADAMEPRRSSSG